jgi:uncharacterized protein involved in exopolysaccharide biosynthesis
MKKIFLFLLFPLTLFAKFETTTVVQVNPSMIAIQPLGQSGGLLTKDYMESEFEQIVAPDTLRDALRRLQPEDAKDQAISDEAVAELCKKISAKPRRGTDFILISAQADTKEEARLLSNAVAEAYIERRKKEEVARAQRALKALDDELVAQSEIVQESRKELTTLIQKFGIPYFEDGNSLPLGMTEKQMLQNARRKLGDFKIMRDQIEIQMKKLVALEDDELAFYAAGLDLPDNQISQHYRQYQKLRTQKLALFDQGLKPTDPKVTALTAQIKKEHAEIQAQVATINENLKAKLELIDRQIERMNEMVQTSEKNTIDLSLKQNQYNQAKEAYEQSRAMLREMKIRQQEARVLLKMPRDPVTLQEAAK